MTEPTRLAAWIRVSRFRGQEHAEEYQETDQDSWASRNAGHEITHRFHELNVSGAKLKRRHLDEILRLLEAGEIDGVIVAYVSRFARSLRVSEEFLARFEALGGILICANENLRIGGPDEDPNQRTAFNYFMAAADAEWRMKRANWARVHKSKIEKGIPMTVPFGYRRAGEKDKTLKIHEDEAAWVRVIFAMRAAGNGDRAIAQFLNDRGAPTPKGNAKLWTGAGVARVYQRRTYLGEVKHGKKVHENAHEPIVDDLLFARAKMVQGKPISRDGSRVLAGLVRCAHCRGTLKGQHTTRGSGIFYACRGESGGGTCEHPAWVLEDDIIPSLRRDYVRILNSKGGYRFKAVSENSDVVRLRGDVEVLERRYESRRHDDDMRDLDHDAWMADVKKAKAALDAAREELTVALKAADSLTVGDQTFAWPDDPAELRKLLTGTFATVFLRGDSRTGDWEHRAFVRGATIPDLPKRGKVNDLPPLVWDRDEPDTWVALG